jgi:hypothetical protein
VRDETMLLIARKGRAPAACAPFVIGALLFFSVACVKTTTSTPLGSPSVTPSLQEEIVAMGQEAQTKAGNRVTVFTYVPRVQTSRSAGPDMIFSAADIKACAGTHATQQTGVSRSQFAVETSDQTGWASVDPVKTPALAATTLKPGQCVRGWITFRVPTAEHPQYVVLLSSNVVKWRI